MLSVVNAGRSLQLVQPPLTIFEGVEEVDPLSTSRNVLANDLALPTLSLPSDTPSDPTPLRESPNTAAASDATSNTRPGVWINRNL